MGALHKLEPRTRVGKYTFANYSKFIVELKMHALGIRLIEWLTPNRLKSSSRVSDGDQSLQNPGDSFMARVSLNELPAEHTDAAHDSGCCNGHATEISPSGASESRLKITSTAHADGRENGQSHMLSNEQGPRVVITDNTGEKPAHSRCFDGYSGALTSTADNYQEPMLAADTTTRHNQMGMVSPAGGLPRPVSDWPEFTTPCGQGSRSKCQPMGRLPYPRNGTHVTMNEFPCWEYSNVGTHEPSGSQFHREPMNYDFGRSHSRPTDNDHFGFSNPILH